MNSRLLFLMSKAQYAFKNYLKREFVSGGVDLSPAQMGILFSLKQGNGLPMTQLGKIISIDNAAITRHADILERKGLVKRVQDEADRRKNIITITDKGFNEAEKCKIVLKQINANIKEVLTDQELELITKILNDVINRFA